MGAPHLTKISPRTDKLQAESSLLTRQKIIDVLTQTDGRYSRLDLLRNERQRTDQELIMMLCLRLSDSPKARELASKEVLIMKLAAVNACGFGLAKETEIAEFGNRTTLLANLNSVPIAKTNSENMFLMVFAARLANSKRDASGLCQVWLTAKMLCINEYGYSPEGLATVGKHFSAVVRALAPKAIAEKATVFLNSLESQMAK